MIKEIKINEARKNTRILVAPLDWGLGHATRCIPIIKELIRLNCEVWIVADKNIFFLLKEEFPACVFLRYGGYEISYSRKKSLFPLKLFFQIPKMALRIFREKKWLTRMVENHSIDGVISDNRFGMYCKKIPCVYITHQLCFKTGTKLPGKLAEKIHLYFIKKFSQCWVPDLKDNGFGGILSHPKSIPENVCYIGPLSRFHPIPDVEKVIDLLASISGPEPQRTIFETIIFQQLKTFQGKALLIRGLPSDTKKMVHPNPGVQVENHVAADELNLLFQQSKILISRSGYTTIMDLAALNKKAILVATPGQPEQEYLATYLHQKGYFFSTSQKNFSIEESLEKAAKFSFQPFYFPDEEYKEVIKKWVASLALAKEESHK